MLALCHLSLGQQLHLFWLHKVLARCFPVPEIFCLHPALLTSPHLPQVGVSAALLATVSGVLSVHDLWGDEWSILAVSLQVSLAEYAPPPLVLHPCPAD